MSYTRRFTRERIPSAVGFSLSKLEHVMTVIRAGAVAGSGIVNG